MIAKIITGKRFGGCVRYLLEREKAKIIDAIGVRDYDVKFVISDLNAQRKLRPTLGNAVGHTVLILLGGHDIANKDIRYNFEEGIKRVKDNLHRYDRIKFVDTEQVSIARLVAFYLHDTGKAAVMNSNIGWFNSFFQDKVLDLAARRINEISSNLTQKIGGQGEEERNDISKGFRRGR